MIIIMQKNAKDAEIAHVEKILSNQGIHSERLIGEKQTVVGIIGASHGLDISTFSSMAGVQEVIRVTSPVRLASRLTHPEDTVITFSDGTSIGGSSPSVVIAGPCAVESEDQLRRTAELVRKNGVRFLRGGAFKPRTSPYSFQGLGFDGLELLKKVSEEFGLFIVTEVMEPAHAPRIAEFADIVQVGARNMQNFPLLRQLGSINKPVLLKRGPASTIEEWLLAAEYILSGGNDQVILCERGIRTYETTLRYTLDLSAVPLIKELSHLPIIVDPSHGTGRREIVAPMSRAALAAGADGVIVEVHPDPLRALSDGVQALTFEMFEEMMSELVRIGDAINRPVLLEAFTKPKSVKAPIRTAS
ncbi:MAG: 3-deoxy-7-phosphoheptulonate synthase [Bacteroidota bacterium]|nr:3-deoxy-7-phosphoheptulonate synthase [Bacteroidota bacterium]MDP4231288.1 3-deoxy-7-phosphoheptulonate synthase [Bacteroidota bacterium]MDP4236022.1 3-deoxy-7-phosphoheptulonate synthase [Bacteroidota bacterium]